MPIDLNAVLYAALSDDAYNRNLLDDALSSFAIN
jgi:hypothetical protein